MLKPYAFLGKPRQFFDLCKVYPPTVNDVVENDFEVYYSMLTMTQEELDDEFSGKTDEEGNPLYIPTPLEFLLANAERDDQFYTQALKAIEFFIHDKCALLIDYKSILIGDIEQVIQQMNDINDLKLITDENFFLFQNMIREACGRDTVIPKENLSKLHPKVRAMKAKARERDKIKAKQEAKKAPSLEVLLASVCCMGIGLTPLNIGEISYASISKLIEANQKKENYQLDCNSLLVGGDPKKVKYWIRNSEN